MKSSLRALRVWTGRASAAHDHARMSQQAYGIGADEHYGCASSTGAQIKRYLCGFMEAWRDRR